MARFHERGDETEQDGVYSLRAGIKGFFHHGVCLDGPDEAAWASDEAGMQRHWPSDLQARAARDRTLGAYSRVQPILHHYHCAIREAGTVLVSAMLHDGWRTPQDGQISAGEPGTNCHAFVIVGYDTKGFIVLNSWGENWGGLPLDDTADPVLARGLARWSYADWARCVVDGWVLRLGVPGQDAFSVSSGPQGVNRGAHETGSTPYRMLQGNFVNLDAGRLQEFGSYPTPRDAVEGTERGIRQRLQGESKGIVLSLPGVMESEKQAFERAVRLKYKLEAWGFDFLTCFWSANFSTDLNAVLSHVTEQCRNQVNGSTELFDPVFEQYARSAGRAFWHEVERHARYAALSPESEIIAPPPGKARASAERGELGKIVKNLALTCQETGKPLHIIANGAGALVVDWLIEMFKAKSNSTDPLDWIPGLGSMVLSFPAVPLDQANLRIMQLARAMTDRRDGEPLAKARIIVASPDLERRMTVHGYGQSILYLASRAFLDRDQNGGYMPMLGSYRAADQISAGTDLTVDAATADPGNISPPFEYFSAASAIRIEQHELDASPELEATIVSQFRPGSQTRREGRPVRPAPEHKDKAMNTHEAPKITFSELQRQISDGSLSAEAGRKYFRIDENASTPFAPVFVPNPDLVEMPPPGSRSALALNSANALARWSRLSAYYSKIGSGYDGPRIAAEGDSWFQYPLRLFDVIDYVAERYAVFDSSAAGDLLENMARKREYLDALTQSGAEILLLSAGGNDVCAGGALADHLESFDASLRPADYLKRGYQDLLDNAIAHYERICRDVNSRFPGVTIITHGYDYVIPKSGRWLGKPMEERGIRDRALQKRIAAEMIDQFNRELRRMAATLSHVTYVDCRGAVANDQWFDELHPDNAGFARVSSRILTKIKEISERSRSRELLVDRFAPRGRTITSPQIVPQSLAGRRNLARSLHIGLNEIDPGHYAGDRGLLLGCENDARAMRDIAEAQGYAPKMLLSREATREAVIEELRRAAKDLKAGDQFLFTNACHGSQIRDFNGDEQEIGNRNPDSTLCLFDGQLIDDELWHLFGQFQSGVRIVMMADSCHSGTIARATLPVIDATRLNSLADLDGLPAQGREVVRVLRPRTLNAATAKAVEDIHRDFYANLLRSYRHVDRSVLSSPAKTTLSAALLQFSACRDDQVAMDGDEHGVFTAAVLNVWNRGKFSGTYRQFHDRIVDALAHLEQKPALFVPAPVDPAFLRQRPFSLVGAELNRETEGMMRPEEPATAAPAPEQEFRDEPSDDPFASRETGETIILSDNASGRTRATGVPVETVARFRDFLAPLRLQHFDAEEFLTLGASHFAPGSAHGLNSAPPEQLWPNIVPTAEILDELRARLGVPVTIRSGYRNRQYNHAVGGEQNSWHMQFRACDITSTASPHKVAETLAQMRGQGMFRGGIGRYAGFTHIDTRGVNADWSVGRGLEGGTGTDETEVARKRLRMLASRIAVAPTTRSRDAMAMAAGDLASADAAVNGTQILSLDRALSEELRNAVLYSTQFAQRAANAAADPAQDHDSWWSTLNAALSAVGWSVQQSTYRRASNSDQDASLDKLALEALAALTSVTGKLNAIRSVLDSLRNAGEGDKRLTLLDFHMSEKASGAFQIGETEIGENGEVFMSIGAVQFRSLDERKGILFARWGKTVDSVGIAAERLIFNQHFYQNVARKVVEERLTDAQSQIMAFKLDSMPA
ncbi:caspase family protein [Paracoccus sp. MBLB3053]|uniref:Caspase family protein n=1 Tax=Paracoccus aurantius TaxID=3073814 RepID=A0ABU2HVB7_9RHOB|nr:D-Ala-D-Ala carboxypeptidase family metallohydrolase [Paracoccus sp. MBLB3053]MDS9468991.1 caspase family protein [Paracoccus sp. MBLB3053]